MKLYKGSTLLNVEEKAVKGEFVEIENEKYYKIGNYDQMQNFFISIISSSDHWMFISSTGALSAGRKNRDNALFPYYTEDKIHDYSGLTGSSSFLIVTKEDKKFLWEPFISENTNLYKTERNLYKSVFGNKIVFEEINHDLKLKFTYGWYNSEKYGFVKKSKIANLDNTPVDIEVLDGIKNILPAGIDYNFQNEYSNLLNAYKKNELIEKTKLGVFSLSSIPVDRAEPSESLFATTVWSNGIENLKILISENQIKNFKNGLKLKEEVDIRAKRGAYFIHSAISLNQESEQNWMIIADINKDSADVTNLNENLKKNENLSQKVNEDIKKGTEELKKKVASADGFQLTNTDLCYARHYSNTMYNIMRGGVFVNNYKIDKKDYKADVNQINKIIAKQFSLWFDQIPENISYIELLKLAEENGDPDLIRITYEYLPLTFSRRHGDPSRPWNLFSIETKDEDGSIKYNYEGNWRDIFQNWEALCYSFPEFIEGIISKFVNATTIDGYNPYRIMRDGIDWESPDPDDPWAYIGYWGDHQIIYLQKLLELSEHFHPGKIDSLLSKEIFTYANVPYKIKSYKEIVQNPKDTIVFDKKLEKFIKAMEELVGADAKFLKSRDVDKSYKANLMEKILVTLLSKLSNFIPEAGIWLNTQRPEWNDANNALVGNGSSMVTLYYLRRFINFWKEKLARIELQEFEISHEVLLLFEEIYRIFINYSKLIDKGFSDGDRRGISEALGRAHQGYREKIYDKSFHGRKRKVNVTDLHDFMSVSLQYIDQSILVNKREDGLFHAYNIINIKKDKISIRYLYEMLEGQVAVLSSGLLDANESLNVLDALKNSEIFRADQYSYMLYPNRQLDLFIEKNIIESEKVKKSKLLTKLLDNNNESIIKVDALGKYHFNSKFRNADILSSELDKLDDQIYKELLSDEKEYILDIYEGVFDHKSFTGRSGTFYGYEGLGSIYWHMVSKLLLACQECYIKAVHEKADKVILGKIKEHYYEIKAGIGIYKSPELYGAFPIDAYSHTPENSGVKQPGLTGQVKEDVISRFGELGIRVLNGEIHFDTSLLNDEEILKAETTFQYYNLLGELQNLKLKADQYALTFCQVPVLITISDENKIIITSKDGQKKEMRSTYINHEISSSIFNRSGHVELVEVTIKNA